MVERQPGHLMMRLVPLWSSFAHELGRKKLASFSPYERGS